MENRFIPPPSLILPLILLLITFSIGCEGGSAVGPQNETQGLTVENRIPAERAGELNWLAWTPDAWEKMTSLGKWGVARKLITPKRGGTVGGEKTLGNNVEFPPGAVDKATVITVRLTCMDAGKKENDEKDDGEPCSAAVDFLPSMQFNSDVTITLSYGEVDFDGDPSDITVYWVDDETGDLFEVIDTVIDEDAKTITFQISHFTRYGWAF